MNWRKINSILSFNFILGGNWKYKLLDTLAKYVHPGWFLFRLVLNMEWWKVSFQKIIEISQPQKDLILE